MPFRFVHTADIHLDSPLRSLALRDPDIAEVIGKGSHITIYYGTRKTVVKDRRKELRPGLLSAMVRQLGLTNDDFR